MMTRAVIYTRLKISTRDKTSSDFDYQLQRCREFAENNGFEIISEIREDYIDGLEWDRPSARRVEEDCCKQ
jgi:DNA invertase Pin-like site-specific DNA recombinase